MVAGKNFTVNNQNLLAHELIGLKVEVMDSTDKTRKGIKGRVIDETKNTLKVECEGKEKVLPKKECVFGFALHGSIVRVSGEKLCFKPEDRVKEYWRKAI